MNQEIMQKQKDAAAVMQDGAAEKHAARQGRWPVGLYQIGQRYYAAWQEKDKR